jgi:selenocysteine lyase/cysteine desulfurase
MIKEARMAQFNLDSGLLDMEHLKGLVDKQTRVVAVAAASNVLGTRSDLKEIGKIAHDAGALFVVDAVHHIAHGPVDVQKIGCDALVFSGYKLFSRHGSFMYLKPELVEKLHPYKVDTAPKHGPEKWEWGTRDQAMFAAISGAIDYLAWLGDPNAEEAPKAGPQRSAAIRKAMLEIEAYEKELSRIILDGYGNILGLRYIPGLTLYGPREAHSRHGRDPTFSFKLAGWDDRDLAKLLWDKYSLAVGAEDYYSRVPPLYGQKTMMRATFVHYNTKQEALAFLRAISRVANKDMGPEEKPRAAKRRPVRKSPAKKRPSVKKSIKKKPSRGKAPPVKRKPAKRRAPKKKSKKVKGRK